MNLTDLRNVLEELEAPPYEYRCGILGDGYYIQAVLWRKDTYSGKDGWGEGPKIYLDAHSTLRSVVMKCFQAGRDYAEHEFRETFRFKGRRICGPHISLEAMWEASELTE